MEFLGLGLAALFVDVCGGRGERISQAAETTKIAPSIWAAPVIMFLI